MGQIEIYDFSITGDCTNQGLGIVTFSVTGDSPNWLVIETPDDELNLPTSGLTTTLVDVGPPPIYNNVYYYSGLSAGSYFLEVYDSTYQNYEIVNFHISSGTCVSIETTDTTCGYENGGITATTEYYYGGSLGASFVLYDINDNVISSGITSSNEYVFPPVSAGTYYVIADDGGGCTGKSASCIVNNSIPFDYGYYVVNDGSCITSEGSGKIFLTGLSDPSLYTIEWLTDVNGQTGTTVTGLTAGLYTVNVTNNYGCFVSKIITITGVEPLGIGGFMTYPPTCFTNDGEINIIVTGGTAPYYIGCSNGDSAIIFNNEYTFTGLFSGTYNFNVIDAGVCTVSGTTSINTANSFQVLSIDTTNSICNNNSGSVNITLIGSGEYTYILTNSLETTTFGPTDNIVQNFDTLSSGDYDLVITDGVCTYETTITIDNTELFTISAITQNTTCGLNNGSIQLLASSGGTLPYSYQITGFPPSPMSTFNNLSPGNYLATVTDLGGCSQTLNLYINDSYSVLFDLVVTQPTCGNNGEISTLIYEGNPTFTYNWSPNVNGQTGTTVTSLSGGTYSLEIIDSSGCTSTETVVLNGTNVQVSYQTYNICNDNFQNTGILGKRSIQQMFAEGFNDLTYYDIGCIIDSTNFIADITVDGENTQQSFYVSSGLTDYPSDYEWGQAITEVLESYSGISKVEINYSLNKIKIYNKCVEIDGCLPETIYYLSDANIVINLKLEYNISCYKCCPDPFISVWDTTVINETINLPYSPSGVYDGTIDWGDGSPTSINSYANRSHTYASVGTYTITINGEITNFNFGLNDPTNVTNLISVTQWGSCFNIVSGLSAFKDCSSLTLTGVTDILDLTNVLTTENMFAGCTQLTTVNNMDSWDVSSVTNMGGMFYYCINFDQPLNSWDVSSVLDMDSMFFACTVFDQDLSTWDVSSVTNMSLMFTYCYQFDQPLNSWIVSGVTNMSFMFAQCAQFDQPLNSWDVSSVLDMWGMFAQCAQFDQPLNSWDVSSVTNMQSMFAGCQVFNQDINSWVVSGVTNMRAMFTQCAQFDQPLNSWDVSSVLDMSFMFYGCSVFNQDISSWDVSSVLDMGGMFYQCAQFDQPLNSWVVSGVTDMSYMFYGCTVFDQDLSTWDVSSVTNMSLMFYYCTQFNQDISSWDVSSVTNMSFMFVQCAQFDQPLNSWDVSSVLDMGFMFYYCTQFNQDINSWDVSSVLDMQYMFTSCAQFDKPLNSWIVSGVTNMRYMFYYCTQFDQDLSTWDVSSVTNMFYMFAFCYQFDQPLNLWDVSSVTNMGFMFYQCFVFNQDLSTWCVQNIPSLPSNFDAGATLWILPRPIWGITSIPPC